MPDLIEAREVQKTAEAILSANGIRFRQLTRMPGCYRNTVFRVDRDYVLRFSQHPDSEVTLRSEAELATRLSGIAPIPKLVTFGLWRDTAFQVWENVKGEQLAKAWANLDSIGRVQLVDELCGVLERVHAIRYEDFGSLCGGPAGYATWGDYLRADLADYPIAGGASPDWAAHVERVRSSIQEYASCCDWIETPSLVHNDLFMTNVIVHQGHIAALIDWELALKGPIDIDVYKFEYFCRSPHIVEVSGEFGQLWELVVRRYPRLFSHPRLQERLNTYDLLTEWRMFRYEVSAGKNPEVLLATLLARTRQILENGVKRLVPRI